MAQDYYPLIKWEGTVGTVSFSWDHLVLKSW